MIFRNDFHDFDYYLENLEIKEETPDGRVPDTTLFCLDTDRNIFVGAVNIRHYLTEELLYTGGHIADGIRPTERRKGYATAMISLALRECRKLEIYKVLLTCDRNNIGSAKSIIKNGGVLENEVIKDGIAIQRYWIDLTEH
ncbi:GNAT family N-acetyltransferase [Leptotrichia sp. OH3620_COT-345]|uniref:GNAT family N-acetyltransferase n=1 Tax=Leptotrichia sp. OH3620_COT-345 TaxID=2491048 RepID=UPI001F3534D1|nr:GNAT family N-acetyltransferase [Leptotrichia sp. OH3620_COT-345]